MIHEIEKYELKVLTDMGYSVDRFKIVDHYKSGIIYHLDVNGIHIAVGQYWDKQIISMQFFLDKFTQVKKEFVNFDDIHGIIVNEIVSKC